MERIFRPKRRRTTAELKQLCSEKLTVCNVTKHFYNGKKIKKAWERLDM
jgi:hypothetical protein